MIRCRVLKAPGPSETVRIRTDTRDGDAGDAVNLSPGEPTKTEKPGGFSMNNSSIATADRVTHLKIVAVSLLAAIMVVAVGITARPSIGDSVTARVKADAPILQAGKPMAVTRSDSVTVR